MENVILGDCTGTEYVDKNGQNGLQYSYCLQSVDNNGNVINEASVSKEIVYFKTPVITSANNTSDNALTLSWAASPGVTGYEIQCSVTSNFSQVKSIQITDAAASSTVIGDLLKDKTYYLKIRAYATINGEIIWSLWSDTASALVKLGKEKQFELTPSITVNPTEGSTSILVSWAALSGASGYEVQYQKNQQGDWIRSGTTTSTSITFSN